MQTALATTEALPTAPAVAVPVAAPAGLLIPMRTADGGIVQVTAADLGAAQQYALALTGQPLVPIPPPPPVLVKPGHSMSLTDALQAWRKAHPKWKPGTVDRNVGDVQAFVNLDQKRCIRDVDRALVLRYLSAISKLKLASQKSRYPTIRSFLRWCVEADLLAANPCDVIGKAHKPWLDRDADVGHGKPQLANMADVLAYLKAAESYLLAADRVMAMMSLLTGLRSGEVLNLQARDIDFAAGWIWIRGPRLKTKNARRIGILHRRMRGDLILLCAGLQPTDLLFPSSSTWPTIRGKKPMGDGPLNKLVKATCRLAKVDVVPEHGMRGTWATFCSMAGLKLPDIAPLAGHGDEGQTLARHYSAAPEILPALPVD